MFVKKTVSELLVASVFVSFFAMTSQTYGQHHAPTPEQLYVDRDRMETCPNCNHQLPRVSVYGWRGSPYFESNRGGCKCGKKSGLTWYNGNRHWQSPFSVLLDHGRKGCRNSKSADTRHPRLRDCLDAFAKVRVLPPVRCDNGYNGLDCDPYGLLGESRRGVTLAPESHHHPYMGQATNDQAKLAKVPTYSRLLHAESSAVDFDQEELVWRQRLAAMQQMNSNQSSTQFDESEQLWPRNIKQPMDVNADVQFKNLKNNRKPNELSLPTRLATRYPLDSYQQGVAQSVELRPDSMPGLSTVAEPGEPASKQALANSIRTESHQDLIGSDLPSARMTGPTRLR